MQHRPIPVCALLLAAVLAAGCGGDDDTPTTPTAPPTEISETVSGTLTRNGGVTHTFVVQRAGNVTATITSLTPSEAVIGISLGPQSVQACSAAVARDNATTNVSLVGTASSAGSFCLRVFDAGGTLTDPVEYAITLRHF